MIDDDPPDDPDDELPSEQPTVDAASREGVRKQERRQDREEREATEFWRTVFADPVGRREMWRLLRDLHPFEERFACGPSGFPQPEATWFEAGKQAVGLHLYHHWTRVAREGVLMMLDEHDPRFAKPKRRKRDRPDG